MAEKFLYGDKVQVKFGWGWDGEGMVTEEEKNDWIQVKMLTGQKVGSYGGFHKSDLTKLDTAAFKVGDLVTVTQILSSSAWNGHGVVEYASKDGNIFGVRMESGRNFGLYGEFYAKRLSKYVEPVTTTVPGTSTVTWTKPAVPGTSVPPPAPKDWIVEFKLSDKWIRSGNKTKDGFYLNAEQFTQADAEKYAAEQNKNWPNQYRAAKIILPISKVEQVAVPNQFPVVKLAKILAVEIGRTSGTKTVTSDDVQAALTSRGYTAKQLGNAAGTLFPTRLFKRTGEYKKSVRPEAHGRRIAVWQYIGA